MLLLWERVCRPDLVSQVPDLEDLADMDRSKMVKHCMDHTSWSKRGRSIQSKALRVPFSGNPQHPIANSTCLSMHLLQIMLWSPS